MSIGIGKGLDMLKGLKGVENGAQPPQKAPQKPGQEKMELPNMLCGCQNATQAQGFDPKQIFG